MVILWMIFIASVIVFTYLYYKLLRATVRQPEKMSKEFSTVYAGNADKEHQGASPININLATSSFLDNSGNPVKVDEYEGFVVSGNSMELAKIKDGDLLLVHKNEIFNDNTPLPGVFVLKRENAKDNQGKYKMRRIWAVAYLCDTNIDNTLLGIMNHPEFRQLKKNEELCLDDAMMLREFSGENGRLDVYKREHPNWNKEWSDESKVVISTTLRTEKSVDMIHSACGRHISFSVHPANLVVGKVAFVYHMPKANV